MAYILEAIQIIWTKCNTYHKRILLIQSGRVIYYFRKISKALNAFYNIFEPETWLKPHLYYSLENFHSLYLSVQNSSIFAIFIVHEIELVMMGEDEIR